MASKQSAAVLERNRRWLTSAAAGYERTPPHNHLSMNDRDAIAPLADRPPNLAA